MDHTSLHIPVLLHESIDGLALRPHDIVVDGTFGGGGHSRAILEAQPTVRLISVDLDEAALARHVELIGDRGTIVHSNFKDVAHIMQSAHIDRIDKVLLDLGTSTFQLLEDTRGFSFQSDAPLSMAFSSAGSHTGFTAWDIANEWSEESIADIIYAYGEDRASRKIARVIALAREQGEIKTSKQLAEIIQTACRSRGRTHPATKTFQAFRIAVNDELSVIREALDAYWDVLAPGGRIAVITFHSLEDRIVKQWMKTHERVITKKPIAPTRHELLANPRSRSAKLRIIEKPQS